MGKLPFDWNPHRPQPAWDATFRDIMDCTKNITGKTDKWNQWYQEASTFLDMVSENFTPSEHAAMNSMISSHSTDYNNGGI